MCETCVYHLCTFPPLLLQNMKTEDQKSSIHLPLSSSSLLKYTGCNMTVFGKNSSHPTSALCITDSLLMNTNKYILIWLLSSILLTEVNTQTYVIGSGKQFWKNECQYVVNNDLYSAVNYSTVARTMASGRSCDTVLTKMKICFMHSWILFFFHSVLVNNIEWVFFVKLFIIVDLVVWTRLWQSF